MGEKGSVKELLVQGHAKVVGNGAQVIVGDGLPDDAAAHGENLDVDLSTLFDGVGKTKGDVKVRTGGKQTVLCPDGCLIVLHQLTGGHGNVRPAGHHPGADAHTLREHHRALGGALPQGTGEIPVGQGQNVGQGNDVGGVAVVDDAVCAIGGSLADAVVHKVAGELAGRLCAALQAPDDAPAVALVVDLHNADAVDRVRLHVAEEFARTGGDEILASQIVCLHPHVHPLPGLRIKEGAALCHFLLLLVPDGAFLDVDLGGITGQGNLVDEVPLHRIGKYGLEQRVDFVDRGAGQQPLLLLVG